MLRRQWLGRGDWRVVSRVVWIAGGRVGGEDRLDRLGSLRREGRLFLWLLLLESSIGRLRRIRGSQMINGLAILLLLLLLGMIVVGRRRVGGRGIGSRRRRERRSTVSRRGIIGRRRRRRRRIRGVFGVDYAAQVHGGAERAVVEGAFEARKSDYIQTEKMKLSKSRDPGPLPDFSVILQPHLFNFTSTLSLRALRALLFSIYIFSLSLHPWQVSKLLFSSHYQHCLYPVWRHTANLCESNRMSLCSPLLSL